MFHYLCLTNTIHVSRHLKYKVSKRPGGGGGHSTFMWTGGAAGGRKPDPVAMRSVHKKYTLSQYNLLKFSYAYPVAILHRRWFPDRGPVINIVGWEPLGSNPVINGVARQ